MFTSKFNGSDKQLCNSWVSLLFNTIIYETPNLFHYNMEKMKECEKNVSCYNSQKMQSL